MYRNRNGNISRWIGLLFVLGIFGILGACGSYPPQIIAVDVKLQLINDVVQETQYERLHVFVNIQDENGLEDVEWVYIIHDEEELFWRLHSGQWERRTIDGNTWVGSSNITMPHKNTVPRGNYRITTFDLGGQEGDASIYVRDDKLVPSADGYPVLELRNQGSQNSQLAVKSNYNDNTLFVYNFAGNLIKMRPYENEPFSVLETVSTLTLTGLKFYIFTFPDKRNDVLIISGPYQF